MAVTLQALKTNLRKELKATLKNIAHEEKLSQSMNITKKLFQNKIFQESSRISIYLHRDIEVYTTAILNEIFSSGKQCFIPKYELLQPIMSMIKLESMSDFESLPSTSWNIKQPSDDDKLREDAMTTGGLDLIIVPGLGFTKAGHRIGNGKGYYDIYLKNYMKTFKKSVYTIALAYKQQILSSIPVDGHDMLINEVIVAD